MLINKIEARKIKNSRKEDTISINLETSDGKFTSSSPSGASKGKYALIDFPKGVDFSIKFVNLIGKKIIEDRMDLKKFSDLKKVENLIENIEKKAKPIDKFSIIGGNALYALEAALLKAMAASNGKELWQFLNEKPKILPRPLGNIIGGGLHIKQDTKADFQEFLILPKTKHFFDAQFVNLQAYKLAKKLMMEIDRRYEGKLTDENSLATTLDNESVLKIMSELRKIVKEKFDIDIDIGLDIASSTFFRNSKYYYKNPEKKLDKTQQLDYILRLIKNYKISYIEDPFNEEDFKSHSLLLKELRKKDIKCLVCGDDLIVTHSERLKKAIKEKAINALIVKPNQIGSLIEFEKVINMAKENDITPIISHRSGETFDNTISHLAVGFQIPIIKTGILGKERFSKINELVRIERSILGNSE